MYRGNRQKHPTHELVFDERKSVRSLSMSYFVGKVELKQAEKDLNRICITRARNKKGQLRPKQNPKEFGQEEESKLGWNVRNPEKDRDKAEI